MSIRSASLLGAAATIGSSLVMYNRRKECASFCSGKVADNSAFVFIKPHANTKPSQDLVKNTLLAKGLTIAQEGEITGEKIDKDMLIDQHYYAIASKATLVKPDKMPVSPEKFKEAFGIAW